MARLVVTASLLAKPTTTEPNPTEEQLPLPACQKEWKGMTFEESIGYCSALAALNLLHRGIGWIWDGRLITKEIGEEHADPNDPDEDPETCHYQLFGDIIYRLRFRGWFNTETQVLCVQDREHIIRHADEIPNQLFEHLCRKFSVKPTKIRIF